jgi:glycosyltransferase involved in cell wall biosynthesis
MKTACIIPVFNTPPLHLMEAVNSVIYQNGVDVAPILVDDGSTDKGTLDALESLVYGGKVIMQTHEKNLGTPSAMNTAHKLIDGIPGSINGAIKLTEYVFLMGSSDISHPDRFRLQLEYMQKHPETDVLGTWLSAFKDDADKLFRKKAWTFDHPEKPSPGYREGHDKFFIVNHGTVCYKQSSVMAVGGYDPKWLRAQDVNLWSRMHANGAVFRNITQVLYAHRR